MGQQHNELRRGPWSNAIAAALGDTKGGGLERYGETMQPVLDIWSRPDFEFLRNERLGGIAISSAAVAAEFSMVALLNPTGSGFLVTVERMVADGAGGNAFLLFAATEAQLATLATVNVGFNRDFRWQGTRPQCSVLTGSDPATFGSALEQRRSPVLVSIDFLAAPPLILPPGIGVGLACLTVNTLMAASIAWRERSALPGELG